MLTGAGIATASLAVGGLVGAIGGFLFATAIITDEKKADSPS
jgi:hypothetical protein